MALSISSAVVSHGCPSGPCVMEKGTSLGEGVSTGGGAACGGVERNSSRVDSLSAGKLYSCPHRAVQNRECSKASSGDKVFTLRTAEFGENALSILREMALRFLLCAAH